MQIHPPSQPQLLDAQQCEIIQNGFKGDQSFSKQTVICNPFASLLHLEFENKDGPQLSECCYSSLINPFLNCADMQHKAITALQHWLYVFSFKIDTQLFICCWWNLWLDSCLTNTFVCMEFGGPHTTETDCRRQAERDWNTWAVYDQK